MKTAIVSNTQVKPSLNNADKIHRLPVNSTPLRSFACEMEEAVTQDLSSIPQVHHRQLQLETTPKVITVPDDRSPKKVKKFQQNHPPLHSTQLFVSQHNDISDAVTKDLSSIKAESLEKGEAISSSVQTVSNFHGSQLSPLRVPASKNPVLTSTPSSSVRGPKTFPGFDMDLSSVLATPNELEVHDSTIVNSMEIVPLEDESIVGLPLYPVGVELHAVVPLPDLKEQKDVQVQQACKLTDISTGKQSDVSQKGNIQQIKCNQQNGKGLDESKMVECTDVHISLRSDSSNKDIGKEQSVKIQTVDCPVDNNIDRDIGVNPKFSSVERNMTIGRVFKSQRKNNTGSRKNGPKLSKGGKARNVCGGCETDKAGKLKHLIKNSNNKMMSLKRTGNHQKIAIYSRAYDTIGGRYCDLGKIDMVPDEVWNTWPKRKTKVYCKTLQSLPRNQPIPNDVLVM